MGYNVMLDLTDVTGRHLVSRLDFFLHAFFWQSCGNILVVSGAMAHLLRDLQWAHPVIFKSMFEQKKVIPHFFGKVNPREWQKLQQPSKRETNT